MIIKLMGEGDDYKWWSMIMDWIIPTFPTFSTSKIQQETYSTHGLL